MNVLTRLTDIQRDFAEENHDLVLQYLRERGLKENDYYDIAVFGYLHAVQLFDEQPEDYDFQRLAYKMMRSEIVEHVKSLCRGKRKAIVYRLDFSMRDKAALLAA
jgi:RNA polymerase sigma-70 factor (ECF subfamily)